MGTIIRTADAAGMTGVIVSKGCVDVYNPKVLRSTMGSIFHIPICQSQDIFEAMDRMKKEELRFVLPILKEVAIILILNTKIILQLLSGTKLTV